MVKQFKAYCHYHGLYRDLEDMENIDDMKF